jgi:hypothetical protein
MNALSFAEVDDFDGGLRPLPKYDRAICSVKINAMPSGSLRFVKGFLITLIDQIRL